MYDLIIVGGGPAGMAAALYAARQRLKFILITESLGGLANYVPELKTYLGYYYLTGYDLVEKFKEHLAQYKVPVKEGRVESISKNDHIFEIVTKKGKYHARTVVIATGRRFKKMCVSGEEKFLGKGLSLCTACDGPLFRNKTVAVVGGGRSGLFATLFLLRIAKKIYLIEQEKEMKTYGGLQRIADILRKHKKVEILTNTKVTEVLGERFVTGVMLKKGSKKRKLNVGGVFVEVGYVPNTECVKHLVKLNHRGEVCVDHECRTSCQGLFAAGDMTQIKEKQVMVSCGEGTKALLSALTFLEKKGL